MEPDAKVCYCFHVTRRKLENFLRTQRPKVASQLRRVRFVLRPYVGYDDIDVAALSDQGILFANIPDTFIEEVANHTLALMLAGNRRDPPWEDEHDVAANGFQLAAISRAKALAQAHQQQQRTHAPGNAKHGEKRAQLVRPKHPQHLAENINKHSHCKTGSSAE